MNQRGTATLIVTRNKVGAKRCSIAFTAGDEEKVARGIKLAGFDTVRLIGGTKSSGLSTVETEQDRKKLVQGLQRAGLAVFVDDRVKGE